MARPIEEFAMAWQALSGNGGGEGWRCFSVSPVARVDHGGQKVPGNEEAMLAGFHTARLLRRTPFLKGLDSRWPERTRMAMEKRGLH